MGRLDGKVAVITGAASGIGRASALKFAEEGATVMCADLELEGARETAAMISARGAAAVAARLDVADSSAVEATLLQAISNLGGLDVVFNNAGVADTRLGWDKMIAINLTGVYNGIFYACELMAKGGGGSVISTASIAGLVGLLPRPRTARGAIQPPGGAPTQYANGAYAASKGAVVQLTRQFAVTYGGLGVRVNAVAPSYTSTPMNAPMRRQEGWEESLASLHPLGRIGQPEEIANAAAFLASDEASFITGVTLPVDGGYTAR